MQAFRAIARVSSAAAMPRVAAVSRVACVPAVRAVPARWINKLSSSKFRTPEEQASWIRDAEALLAEEAEAKKLRPALQLDDSWPKDLPMRVDENGVSWADYRPENLRNLTPVRNEDGDLVGRFEGEDVIFPDLEPTLEWVLTSPVELHLFEEAPIVKCYEEEADEYAKDE